jgi:asparagine synthase (glutamine-hydrolysing)
MCGIAGYLSNDPSSVADLEMVKRMCANLTHRGPDDFGVFGAGPAVLGHRRLSIIDLSPEAAQPMKNENGSILLVVNGEIYNFQELREDLIVKGHRFTSSSDSEVILHLYEDIGLDFLDKLRGMFSLAIWDKNRQELILARDRFGKKPLFYHQGKSGLVFSSELQSLVTSKMFDLQPDLNAIDSYLALQYVPSPMSAYRNVCKLPPGHYIICQPGQECIPKKYYELSFARQDQRSFDDLALALREKIEESVKIRLVSDVPLGAFLSGGIDSSVVVAFMSKLSSQPVKTFSIGFPSKDHSELEYARMVAKHFNCDHHDMIVEPDMTSIVPKLVKHYGEPYGDTSAVPTWYLSEFTKSKVTVALSGDAGDEGYAGYNRYRLAQVARILRRLPTPLAQTIASVLSRIPIASMQPIRDFGRRLMQPEVTRYLGLVAHFPYDDRIKLYSPEMQERFSSDAVATRFQNILDHSTAQDAVARLLDLDIQTYLSDDILVKVDIASMAHALEVRCPLLDQELMSLVASIPSNMKIKGIAPGKLILKKAVEKLVPKEILERKKRGFALPIDRWMRENLADMSRDILLSTAAISRGLFERKAIATLLDNHQKGESRGLQIWNLLMLEQWFRIFIDGKAL